MQFGEYQLVVFGSLISLRKKNQMMDLKMYDNDGLFQIFSNRDCIQRFLQVKIGN